MTALETNVCWYKRAGDAHPHRLDPDRTGELVSDDALNALASAGRRLAAEPDMEWVVLVGDTPWSTPIEILLAPEVRAEIAELQTMNALRFGPALATWLRNQVRAIDQPSEQVAALRQMRFD